MSWSARHSRNCSLLRQWSLLLLRWIVKQIFPTKISIFCPLYIGVGGKKRGESFSRASANSTAALKNCDLQNTLHSMMLLNCACCCPCTCKQEGTGWVKEDCSGNIFFHTTPLLSTLQTLINQTSQCPLYPAYRSINLTRRFRNLPEITYWLNEQNPKALTPSPLF